MTCHTGLQMVESGLATHLVSSQKLEALEEELTGLGDAAADAESLERVLSSFQVISSILLSPCSHMTCLR